jgi:hypothetical protein
VKNPVLDVMGLVALAVMLWAAVDALVWLHGLGLVCAVWFLAPYRVERSR